jgi:GH43 family beta-xylosidase
LGNAWRSENPNNPPHVNVNEGPEVLAHGDQLFLIYSASGCWTEYYALGMLRTSVNSNLMDPRFMEKIPATGFQTITGKQSVCAGT